MPDTSRFTSFDRRFARHAWRLVGIFWRARGASWGTLLLGVAITLEIAMVWGNVLVADAERRILDALAQRAPSALLSALGVFFEVSLLVVFAAAYRIYVRGALEIRWRRNLTTYYTRRWIGPHAHVLEELHGTNVDNPDQRIQEDVRDFVASALGLALSLLAAVATLLSFGHVLWQLSTDWPLPLVFTTIRVPGLMLWVALGYALTSMWLTHVVGRRLVPINFDRLRVEADFRHGLMRFRDNTKRVALVRGEPVERREALARFQRVVDNWWQLLAAQRTLAVLTTGIGQVNTMVPLAVAVPAYFAGLITLGSIVQIRIAYTQVSSALTWFVYAYQEIARWRANVERLSTLSEAIDATEHDVAAAKIRVVPVDTDTLRLENLRIEEPNGRVLLDGANASLTAGDRLAITGPSGTGKTLLIRAIAGIWPFGAGAIEIPARARMVFVPQWPYMPTGTLRAAVSYPAPAGAFPDELVVEVLLLLGLDTLAQRLGDTAPWEQVLSPHEQQRVALVRALLQNPDWLFLDKATSALDEDMERRVYALLDVRLPRTTVVSIAHRPDVERYHSQRWTLSPVNGRIILEAA